MGSQSGIHPLVKLMHKRTKRGESAGEMKLELIDAGELEQEAHTIGGSASIQLDVFSEDHHSVYSLNPNLPNGASKYSFGFRIPGVEFLSGVLDESLVESLDTSNLANNLRSEPLRYTNRLVFYRGTRGVSGGRSSFKLPARPKRIFGVRHNDQLNLFTHLSKLYIAGKSKPESHYSISSGPLNIRVLHDRVPKKNMSLDYNISDELLDMQSYLLETPGAIREELFDDSAAFTTRFE